MKEFSSVNYINYSPNEPYYCLVTNAAKVSLFFFLTKMCLFFLFSQIILNGQISNILNSVKVGKRSSDVYSDESCLLIAILKLKIDKESSPSFTCNFNSFMTEVPTISYRNQSIDLQSKSMDWFLYDRDLCREGVKIRVIGIITVKRI